MSQVLCGHHPYVEIQSDILVMNMVMDGTRPEKPQDAARLGFNDELWNIVKLCWSEDRNVRPRIDGIASCLDDATAFWYMREF